MRAFIQHKDNDNQKLILQALVPFSVLRESVLFTYRAKDTQKTSDKYAQYEASMEYYQRRVDSKRSNDIKDFIRKSILLEKDGSQLATLFPTSMILALSVDEEGVSGNILKINDDDSCELDFATNVFIVDGQHRMMGMIKLYNEVSRSEEKTKEEQFIFEYLQDYKFNCIILINYDLWEQGQVFVNVNFKQKPVNKSLYYEVFGSEYRENEMDWGRNKIYVAHKIAKTLNEHPQSPFCNHIKMLGTGSGYVSQAFVVESLQRNFKNGGLWYFDPDEAMVNEDYYATELLSYFVAIKKLFPDYWPKEEEAKGTIICKTTGFGAWIRLMAMMRNDDDAILLKELMESAKNDEICLPYVEHVTELLAPLKKYGEDLFGKDSEFASSSGQGAESKMYRRMLYYRQRQLEDEKDTDTETYPFNQDKIEEELQEYVWTNIIDELDILGHHYEVENIEDFKILGYKKGVDTYEIKTTFRIYVNIFMDNEDDTGFNMEFPAEAKLLWHKEGGGFHLDEGSVKVIVNTDKYYQ